MCSASAKLGYSINIVKKWDNGHLGSPMDKCVQLAKVLGVPVRELFEKQNRIKQPSKW
jgi:ribosome-binding protein aMBF1 (putative translation factor)